MKTGAKKCSFCEGAVSDIDYKDSENLRKFVSPHAAMLRKKKTGVCAKHQRKLSLAIKRARFMALLPYISG